MASESKALATTTPKGVVSFLASDAAKAKIQPMLPVGVEYERVLGEIYLAVSQNPAIAECTPASIVRAVSRAVSWGLIIGETVHLVPFNVNVAPKDKPKEYESRLQAIQDWKGKIELVVAAGGAKSINAQCVYLNETFEYLAGSEPKLTHIPSRKSGDRGALIGAYAIADHGYNRHPGIVFMPIEDIDAIRTKLSKSWGKGPCPPWYARKTAVHQLAKMLPKNPRLALAIKKLEEDDDLDLPEGEPVAVVAAPKLTAVSADAERNIDEFSEVPGTDEG